MRLTTCAFSLSLAAVVSCSADHAVAPEPIPKTPHASSSLILGLNGTTPLYNSAATAINDSGTVAGNAQPTITDRQQAAVWSPPDYHLTLLPDLESRSSTALSIGNDGTIGGRICDSGNFQRPCHPVYWRDGILHQLGGLGEVKDVCPCDGHTLVGLTVVNGHDHGAIWEDDILIDVGTPAGFEDAELVSVARGYIVGVAYLASSEGLTHFRSFRWSPLTGWVGMGDTEAAILGVNAQGSAVGTPDLLWPNGSNTSITIPGGGLVSAINDSGVVAGSCPNPPGSSSAFLPCEWTSASGWNPIGTETFAAVTGINNSNMAVGELFQEGRPMAVLWTP
jgi:uncharacterized membrane protein